MYPDVIAGAELFAYELSRGFVERDHDVFLIAHKGRNFRTSINKGIHFCAYKNVAAPGVRSLIGVLQTFFKLISIRPHVCLGIKFESVLACYLYKKIFKRPIAIRLTGTDFVILQGKLQNRRIPGFSAITKLLYSLTYYPIFLRIRTDIPFVALNKEMMRDLLRLGVPAQNLALIYNCVEDSFFEIIPESKKFTVIFCGRLVPIKKVDTLVKAFSIVIKSIPNSRLLIVGDGNERKNIDKLIDRLNLCPHVEMCGFIEPDDVKNYLAKSTIFVLASHNEGTPNSLIQAMAAGLPIVATKVGGIPDLVENNYNGFLVKSNDEEELARAIISINQADILTKFGANSRIKAQDYRKGKTVNQYLTLFNSMLKSNVMSKKLQKKVTAETHV